MIRTRINIESNVLKALTAASIFTLRNVTGKKDIQIVRFRLCQLSPFPIPLKMQRMQRLESRLLC